MLVGVERFRQCGPTADVEPLHGHFDDNQYYQQYKGRLCEPVLEAMGLPYYVIEGPEQLSLIVDGAREAFLKRMPVVLLLRKQALAKSK